MEPMQLSSSDSSIRTVLLVIVTFLLSSCISFRPVGEQTVTLEPEKSATIFGVKRYNNFGVCWPFSVDRRGTGLYLFGEFLRQLDSSRSDYRVRDLAGYEVAVTRGESCHLRIVDTFQTAVKFDLSSLPAGAVVKDAELRVHRYFSPQDPPRLRGNRAQCTVIMIGQASESWNGGIYHARLSDGARPFINWRPARPDTGPHDARGTRTMNLDVTRTASEWVIGTRPNHGFVITPDLDRVMQVYNAIEQGGFFCDVGITGYELVLRLAVPE